MINLLRQFTLILLLLPLLGQHCFADTLYERSMALFQAKALKANPDDYFFVVLGDSRDDEAMFKKALRLAKSLDPLFILHGGDYSDHGGAGETAQFLKVVRESVPQVPLFVIMGNHESRAVFAREIGPFDFTLQSGRMGLTVVALDNADYVLRPTELAYLESRLAKAAGVRFVAMHIPPKTKRWSRHTFTRGADELKDIVERQKVQGLFFSHIHLFDQSEFGGVPALITGGAGAQLTYFGFTGEAEKHILLVRVKNGKPSFRKVPIPE